MIGTFINNQRLAKLAGVNFDSEKIQPGPIVYSRTHTVVGQFGDLAKMGECVLVTSFSDACCTSAMARRLPPNVRRWYSNNVMTQNPKVVAVPLGIRTSPDGERILADAIEKGPQARRNLVYMNFLRLIRNGNNPRRGVWEQFTTKAWVTREGGFEHVPMKQFYDQMASHSYVLSPPGAGPDCHRHWEAIMLGSIPIVLRSHATRILEGLPCLQVDNWGQVTPQRLEQELPELSKLFDSPAMERIWFEPWRDMILGDR